MRTLRLLVLLLASVPAAALAQTAADREGVQQAVLDYVEGFYEGDTTRFLRSIRPEVYKYGFGRRPGGYVGMQMEWPEFHAFANRVKSGAVRTPPNAPKRIEILDVADQTAAAKLTAWWGIDYLLLAKFDGRWMITHVLWQSPPPAAASR